MATMTQSKPNPKCLVIHGADFVQVTSPSGKACRVEVKDLPQRWDFFQAKEENDLLDKLIHGNRDARKIELSFPEMKLFLQMAKRVDGEKVVEPVKPLESEKPKIHPLPAQKLVLPSSEAKATEAKLAVITANARQSQQNGQGLDQMERNIDSLQKLCKEASDGYSALFYDIPSDLQKECPNPSNVLWRISFRFNLSCWILPNKNREHQVLQDLLSHWKAFPSVKAYVKKWDQEENESIREIAKERLAEQLRELHTSLLKNIDSADSRLREALEAAKTEKEQQLVSARRENEIRAILRKSSENLDQSIECASIFDESGSTTHLVQALRLALRSQIESFNSRQVKERNTVDQV